MTNKDDYENIKNGIMSPQFTLKIYNQVLSDLYKYVPRYLTCFLNSNRQKYYSWYYGVTDNGIVAGFPLNNDNLIKAKADFDNAFSDITNNMLKIIVPVESLHIHQQLDNCRELHTLIEYQKNSDYSVSHINPVKKFYGYSCDTLNNMIDNFANFQIIPLQKPNSTDIVPFSLINLVEKFDKNIVDMDNYKKDYQQYQKLYEKWLDGFIYYSSKIDLLLKDPILINEITEFLKKYNLSEKDFCQITDSDLDKCFKVGNKYLRDPPFLQIFRDFRDQLRLIERQSQPVPPIKVKDIRKVLLNRLFLTGFLLINNPDLSYTMFKISCRSLNFKQIYKAIYFDGKHWHYQMRTLKNGKIPSCEK